MTALAGWKIETGGFPIQTAFSVRMNVHIEAK